MWTLEQLKYCKESEDKVEFKKENMGISLMMAVHELNHPNVDVVS